MTRPLGVLVLVLSALVPIQPTGSWCFAIFQVYLHRYTQWA